MNTIVEMIREGQTFALHNGRLYISGNRNRRLLPQFLRLIESGELAEHPEVVSHFRPGFGMIWLLAPLIHVWVERRDDGVFRIHWYRGVNYWYKKNREQARGDLVAARKGETGFEPATFSELTDTYQRLCDTCHKLGVERNYQVVTEEGLW